MTRATFLSSCMSPSLVCRRPAVSMITTSVPRVTAASMAEKATAAGSPPGCAPMKSLPLRSAHTRSWLMAPARKVSPAAIITLLPSRRRRVASFPMKVVLPAPLTPSTSTTAGLASPRVSAGLLLPLVRAATSPS